MSLCAGVAGVSRPASSRVECLDGLRGLAALWVLMGHCVMLVGWSLPVVDKPDLGVDLFMMLSGFLMVFHYQERAEKEPWSVPGTWWRFWLRRYFRISPLYYAALAVVILLGPALLVWRISGDQFGGFATPPASAFTDHSFKNVLVHLSFLFGLLPNYSVRTALPDWSLGLEMQFYAVFPALMLLTKRLGWVCTVFSMALLAALITHVTWHLSIRYPMASFLPFKIDIFLAGMLVAQCCRVDRRAGAIYFALALVLALQPFEGEGSFERIIVREVLVVVFFSLIHSRLLPAYLGDLAHKTATLLSRMAFRWLGEISYSTYLWHLPIATAVVALVIVPLGHNIAAPARFSIAFLLVCAIVYPLSWLTFTFIEVPGQAFDRAILRRMVVKSATAQDKKFQSSPAQVDNLAEEIV